MITYTTEPLLESDAQVLVCPVNCEGVMGAGLAKAFKEKFPYLQVQYDFACSRGQIVPGNFRLIDKILLMATKDRWREPSQLFWVESAVYWFAKEEKWWKGLKLQSFAFPQLGCGCGGLKWWDVKPIMKKYLEPLDLDIRIHIR